ncbi:Hsp20/alpha crystallin family protein [bacterium]|nr:Hsp20/alpha crystallin family protein [bacterium]
MIPDYPGFDRVFNSFFSGSELSDREWMPSVDLSESKDGYELVAEIPGMDRKDITVSLKDNILTLSGEKKIEKKDEDKNHFRSERVFGKFERSFKLAGEVKSDDIKAKYKDGVLTIEIPKDEKKNSPKMISVN